MPEIVHPETRFERKDIDIPPLLWIAGGLVVVVVISCVVSWWCFDYLRARDRATKVSPFPLAAKERNQLPAEPRLEELNRMQAAEEHKHLPPLYAAEKQRLKETGWVDEEKKIVHIPIEDAMNLLVEEGRLRSRPEAKKTDKGNGRQP